MATERAISVELSDGEVALLIEALDPHEYRQLSESHERNDDANDEVDAVRALIAKLGARSARTQ